MRRFQWCQIPGRRLPLLLNSGPVLRNLPRRWHGPPFLTDEPKVLTSREWGLTGFRRSGLDFVIDRCLLTPLPQQVLVVTSRECFVARYVNGSSSQLGTPTPDPSRLPNFNKEACPLRGGPRSRSGNRLRANCRGGAASTDGSLAAGGGALALLRCHRDGQHCAQVARDHSTRSAKAAHGANVIYRMVRDRASHRNR